MTSSSGLAVRDQVHAAVILTIVTFLQSLLQLSYLTTVMTRI